MSVFKASRWNWRQTMHRVHAYDPKRDVPPGDRYGSQSPRPGLSTHARLSRVAALSLCTLVFPVSLPAVAQAAAAPPARYRALAALAQDQAACSAWSGVLI